MDIQFTATEQPIAFSVAESPVNFALSDPSVSFQAVEQALTFPTVSEVIDFTVAVEPITFSVQGIILQGPPGPAGSSEEDMPYAKRIDWISDSVLYKGEAEVGAATSDPVWRIRKITLGADDDMTEVWAGGTATFDKIWDNRAGLTYS